MNVDISSIFRWISFRVLYTVFGIFVGVLIVSYMYGFDDKSILIVRTVSSGLLVVSILMTASQFIYNIKWNKKDAGNKAIYTASKKTHDLNDKINPFLNTTYMIQNNKALCVADIHNKMGVFLNGGRFVFHGDETDSDIQNIHTHCDSLYRRDFDKTINGREIESIITLILNEYEYISVSCNNGIFDKKIIIDLRGPSIVSTFNLFSTYIYHERFDTNHNYGKGLYIEFENFAKEIGKKLGREIFSPKNTNEYLTDFDERSS